MKEHGDMLTAIGVKSVEDLFSDVPMAVRTEIKLPPGMDEIALDRELKSILARNQTLNEFASFLGGGIYNHYIPPAVNEILARNEFYTAYTPYQPEISQGMLQAIFEYQSLVCELTGMDCANASMYDGATAIGEAALMAKRIKDGSEFIIPKAMSPAKKSVLRNYTEGAKIKIREIPYRPDTGTIDVEALKESITPETFGIYLETPNYFGSLETEIKAVREICKGVLVLGVNPLSLAVIKPPSEYGADIVVGDSILGNPPAFGGPLAGIFATRKEYLWKMPGRIVGFTMDREGLPAFCLTLQPREQHIRRAKATSNICSNEALSALAFLVHACVLGRHGLKKIALTCMKNARKLRERLRVMDALVFEKATIFNEFVYRADDGFLDYAYSQGVLPGIRIPGELGIEDGILCGVTELNTDAEIEKLVDIYAKFGGA